MKLLLLLTLFCLPQAHARKFYHDDPLESEPPPRPVKNLQVRKLSYYFDLFSHQFGRAGQLQPEKGPKIRAQAVNTLGEPYQSSWWQKRHYYRTMTAEELVRGPGQGSPPADGKFTVISAKTEGITPGFVMIDAEKRRYFVKFDPLSNPEMATAADAITSRLYYAMGYNVPQNYIIYFTEDQLQLGENVEVRDAKGRPRKMTEHDLYTIMSRVPRDEKGRYRGTASLALPGKPIGPPRYYATRADDPNDTVPHEHRRDQRALQIPAAWVAHDDSRAINNLDIITQENGIAFVKHYQLDFGSTLGSASQKANSPRSGIYFFDWKQSAQNLFSLGLYVPYWQRAKYPNYPAVGRFEWQTFDPERWVPEYPNTAFLNRLPDDEFWGAKQVMAFTDEDIRTIVRTGQINDPDAEAWLIECLLKRRDKIGRTYFAKLLPLDKFAISDGRLTWVDLSEKYGFGGAGPVTIRWSTFDNESERATPVAGATTQALPAMNGDGYWVADIGSVKTPVHHIAVYVRSLRGSKQVVGIERQW